MFRRVFLAAMVLAAFSVCVIGQSDTTQAQERAFGQSWGTREGAQNLNRFYHYPYVTYPCLLYTSPSPRDQRGSRMPSSA